MVLPFGRYGAMVLPFGRFQWTRLPISTAVAQDIFQSKLDFIFIGMEGVTGIADDMVNAETTLQMDASKKGLGACIIQKGKVVCYASRALTKTEQNYQNLEREALGTIWGMEKFHYFLTLVQGYKDS